MRILVEIAGWEQGCCGRAFAIGKAATWRLVRAERDEGPLPRFVEEHHGQTAPGVPHLEVTGTVRRISEVHRHRRRSLPVLADELNEFDVSECDVESVSDRGSSGGPTYRVELDVADGVALPDYVADPASLDRTDRQNREAAELAGAMHDALGARMRHALQTTAARVTRNDDGSIAALETDTPGAATLSWRRRIEALQIQAGEGRFTVHSAAEFDHVVTGVHAGRIREEVSDSSLRTVIEAADGEEIAAVDAINAFVGNGFRALDARTAARIRRGSFRYEPW